VKFLRRLTSTLDGRQQVTSLIKWKTVDSEICDDRTGKVIFSQKNVTVPEQWSEHATNILAQKYFRKAGVPSNTKQVYALEDYKGLELPLWLFPRAPVDDATFGGEISAVQVFHRLAGCWTYWGWREGYFDDEYSARAFYDEVFYALAMQYMAPNSPQWFNTGLHWAYGITGEDTGQWYVPSPGQGEDESWPPQPVRAKNAYERPQPHACFLTGTEDHLVAKHGIMDTWSLEARIFKYGSGSGVNVSPWRAKGEKLTGGGVASGVMSWLRIGDSAAGSIASGGTTRRAAKMVQMNDDHPELLEFIRWKAREEHKAAALNVGSEIIRLYSEEKLPAELHHLVPHQTKDRLAQGFEAEIFGIGFEEEANRTIDGQNSNNSIRVSDALLKAVEKGENWNLYSRTEPRRVLKQIKASELLDEIYRAAWACADPGLIFDDTVNAWNTCAADGWISTTNPCAEFHHLTWSACNLASSRLTAFLQDDGVFDHGLFAYINRLLTVILDISVSMASFPAPEFAVGAYNYRTLGLGYSDLGSLLMRMGLPYDSDEGRSLAALITALMTGVAYKTSAEMAESLGPFPRWQACENDFMSVMRNHWRALDAGFQPDGDNLWEKLNVKPYCAISKLYADKYRDLFSAVDETWEYICEGAGSFRNAQVSLIAPTGTISFAMDCDTTGIEPEFSLLKIKNLSGGGNLEIVSRAIEPSLKCMGYNYRDIKLIVRGISKGESIEKLLTTVYPGMIGTLTKDVLACSHDISPEGHLLMLAAIQPFLCGAASKTINVPPDATIADVGFIYRLCHQLGIKSVALYRENSKLAQPMQRQDKSITKVEVRRSIPRPVPKPEPEVPELPKVVALGRGEREFLPWCRKNGYTQKARIGDQGREQTLFWHVSEFSDGRPGELFIVLAKQGSTLRAAAEALAIAISIGLQRGVPLEAYANQFMGVSFEPAGYVEGHEEITFSSSFIDLILRDMAIRYLGRDDLRRTVPAIAVDNSEKIVALDRIGILVAQGSQPTGRLCLKCGGILVQDGRCLHCTNCNWNEGCSG
jgi:ribonucleoside-diphosphate reductase alpha chain